VPNLSALWVEWFKDGEWTAGYSQLALYSTGVQWVGAGADQGELRTAPILLRIRGSNEILLIFNALKMEPGRGWRKGGERFFLILKTTTKI
jgi:hypothetical protein